MDPLEGLDSILTDLVKDARVVLGPNAMGIYLYGSAVSGGFDPGVSDLDLVVVTDAEVGSIDLAGLERMHTDFVGRHPEWDDRIEVVYIGQATLRSFRTSPGSLAVISPGESFHVTGPVVDWDQNWYQVREYGVALFGTPAAEVIPLDQPVRIHRCGGPICRLARQPVAGHAQPTFARLHRPVALPRSSDRPDREAVLEAGGSRLDGRADARLDAGHRRVTQLPPVPWDDRLRRRGDAACGTIIYSSPRRSDLASCAGLMPAPWIPRRRHDEPIVIST